MARTFMKLARPELRKLEPLQKVHEHGITFQRLANGDGVYSINVMVDGQRIHRVIGKESDGTTRTQAEEFIQKVRRDARDDRLCLPKGRKTVLTLADAARRYLKKLEDEGGRDLVAKRRRLKQHLVPFFGDMLMTKISTFDIERYKKRRSEETAVPGGERQRPKDEKKLKKTSNGTINRELAVLSHLFNKAVEWGWIPSLPGKIKRLKEDEGRIVYLTVEQISRLLESAQLDQNPQVQTFIMIGIETSMRRSEILAIKRKNVDLERGRIFIPQAKAGMREQPIPRHLADYLKRHIEALPRDTEWLFPSGKAKSGHTVNIEKPFRRAVVAAGLDPAQVVRHTLRHTAITHLIQAGVDLPTVKRISGHKTLAMVERYAHQNGSHIAIAMEKLQERLDLVRDLGK